MKREDRIKYWTKTADLDYSAMNHFFESGEFLWCLFVGHLVIEKLLKALYVKHVKIDAPRIHDLTRLADLAKLELSEAQEDELDTLTKFCITARYPDYKFKMHKVANKRFTQHQIKVITELRQWLLQQI